MKGLPYWPMYAADFMAGTATMTDAEVGVYVRLLNYAWLNDGLPLDLNRVRKITGLGPAAFTRVWSVVGPKWRDNDYRLINKRQEQERVNVQRRSDVGKANAAQRWESKGNATAMPRHKQTPCKTDGSSESESESDPKKDTAGAVSSRAPARLTPLIARMNGDVAYPWRVPFPGRLWAEFIAKIGGTETAAEQKLTAWVQSIIAQYPPDQPVPDAGDSYIWWRKQSVSLFPRAPVVSAKSQATRDALAEFNRRHS